MHGDPCVHLPDSRRHRVGSASTGYPDTFSFLYATLLQVWMGDDGRIHDVRLGVLLPTPLHDWIYGYSSPSLQACGLSGARYACRRCASNPVINSLPTGILRRIRRLLCFTPTFWDHGAN